MSSENKRSLSERDLLIKLTTEVEHIKEEIKNLSEKIDGSQEERGKITQRIAVCEQQVRENTKLRDWFVGSIIGHAVEIAAIIGLAVLK